MDRVLLCWDVGGTEIKGAAIKNGRLITQIRHFPARANLNKEDCYDILRISFWNWQI